MEGQVSTVPWEAGTNVLWWGGTSLFIKKQDPFAQLEQNEGSIWRSESEYGA